MPCISLNNINFGYADAEMELQRTPEIFDNAFFDPKSYLNDLLNGPAFLLLGRKGSGKTAYSAKIRRMAQSDKYIIARPSSLTKFDYTMFESFAGKKGVIGGRRFMSTWTYLLLVEIVKLVRDNVVSCENERISALINALEEHGILSSEDIVHSANFIKKRGVELSIDASIASVKGQRSTEETIVINDMDEISELMTSCLSELYFGDISHYLLIDGLDDALRCECFASDVIMGLVRASQDINRIMFTSSLKMKIVILLRTDIWDKCKDPDKNKITRDESINLLWDIPSLDNIVLKRIQQYYPDLDKTEEMWKYLFRGTYLEIDIVKCLYQHTLLRPRDILAFMIECKNANPILPITESDMRRIVSRYSMNYFIREMEDELTGFTSDINISHLITTMSRLKHKEFWVNKFIELMRNYVDIDQYEAMELLEYLFAAGYIGQYRENCSNGRSFIVHKYINLLEKFQIEDKCCIHRGLRKALSISEW